MENVSFPPPIEKGKTQGRFGLSPLTVAQGEPLRFVDGIEGSIKETSACVLDLSVEDMDTGTMEVFDVSLPLMAAHTDTHRSNTNVNIGLGCV